MGWEGNPYVLAELQEVFGRQRAVLHKQVQDHIPLAGLQHDRHAALATQQPQTDGMLLPVC